MIILYLYLLSLTALIFLFRLSPAQATDFKSKELADGSILFYDDFERSSVAPWYILLGCVEYLGKIWCDKHPHGFPITGNGSIQSGELSLSTDSYWYSIMGVVYFNQTAQDFEASVNFKIMPDDKGSSTNVGFRVGWLSRKITSKKLNETEYLELKRSESVSIGYDGFYKEWVIVRNISNRVERKRKHIDWIKVEKGNWINLKIKKIRDKYSFYLNNRIIDSFSASPTFKINFLSLSTGVGVHGENGAHVHFDNVTLYLIRLPFLAIDGTQSYCDNNLIHVFVRNEGDSPEEAFIEIYFPTGERVGISETKIIETHQMTEFRVPRIFRESKYLRVVVITPKGASISGTIYCPPVVEKGAPKLERLIVIDRKSSNCTQNKINILIKNEGNISVKNLKVKIYNSRGFVLAVGKIKEIKVGEEFLFRVNRTFVNGDYLRVVVIGENITTSSSLYCAPARTKTGKGNITSSLEQWRNKLKKISSILSSLIKKTERITSTSYKLANYYKKIGREEKYICWNEVAMMLEAIEAKLVIGYLQVEEILSRSMIVEDVESIKSLLHDIRKHLETAANKIFECVSE